MPFEVHQEKTYSQDRSKVFDAAKKSVEKLKGQMLKSKPEDFQFEVKFDKTLLGKVEHYYTKASVGLFIIENQELHVGDKILISGPTTGNEALVLEKMMVNGTENTIAKQGDKVTFEVPFRLRLSDKLYKLDA